MKSLGIIVLVFALSLLIGYLFGSTHKEQAKDMMNEIFSSFKIIKNLKSYEIFLLIFVNNSVKAFLSMVLGIFLGIVPILFVSFNGFLIGVFASVFGEKSLAILPHGVLEIPAILLSCSYGLDLGIQFYRKIRGSKEDMNKAVLDAIRKFLKIPLPMLIVAAFVETYVTPLIV